jgi:predicted RNA binding protein YcfA (HicA-like mRNA interferase family)
MPRLTPVSRGDFISKFKSMGFAGPLSGSDHEYMERGTVLVKIPNPHGGDISVGLLRGILRNTGISRQEWFNA